MRALLYVVPALVLLITHFVVYRIGAARGKKKAISRYKNEAICACNHPRSFHIDGKGSCKHNDEGRRCTCQVYDGPESLPSFYAPEIE